MISPTFDENAERRRQRIALLGSRGGLRAQHWLKVRRRRDLQDTTPLPHEGKPSIIYRMGCWYERVEGRVVTVVARVAARIYELPNDVALLLVLLIMVVLGCTAVIGGYGR